MALAATPGHLGQRPGDDQRAGGVADDARARPRAAAGAGHAADVEPEQHGDADDPDAMPSEPDGREPLLLADQRAGQRGDEGHAATSRPVSELDSDCSA